MDERLLVFTRFPRPGEVKTRLAADIGPDRAATLHEAMTRWTIAIALRPSSAESRILEVHGDGASPQAFEDRFGSGPLYFSQSRGDLGRKMLDAFTQARLRGSRRTVVVGTDCPGLDD